MPQLITGRAYMTLRVCCFILANFGIEKSMDGMARDTTIQYFRRSY